MKKGQINTLVSSIIALVVVLLGGQQVYKQVSADTTSTGPFDESLVRVVEVVDGDTFKAQDEHSKVIKTVRMIGMDTPETKDPRKPVQYYGKEASDYSKKLLLNMNVTLTKDVSDTDRYGRLLRFVYLGDGTFVNEKLVREGYAKAYSFPPDISKAEIFTAAEADARANKRGLWQ